MDPVPRAAAQMKKCEFRPSRRATPSKDISAQRKPFEIEVSHLAS